MYTRWSKIVLVFSVAVFAMLVVFNNLTDYGSNYLFVSHVLSMDTTFPGNNSMWRAITWPLLHHAAYGVIIGTECAISLLCWVGTCKLYRARENANRFNQEKKLAICGLTLGIFFGIILVYLVVPDNDNDALQSGGSLAE